MTTPSGVARADQELRASVRWGVCPCGVSSRPSWVVRDRNGLYVGCCVSWHRAMRIANYAASGGEFAE